MQYYFIIIIKRTEYCLCCDFFIIFIYEKNIWCASQAACAFMEFKLQTMTCFTDLNDLQKPFIFSTLIYAIFKNE